MEEMYPSHTNQELADYFNTSRGVVGQFAVRHGWRKSKDHLHRVRNRKK